MTAWLVGCPECGECAEVVDHDVLQSTDGPVEHLRVRCVRRHWFYLRADRVPGFHEGHATARPPRRPEVELGFVPGRAGRGVLDGAQLDGD